MCIGCGGPADPRKRRWWRKEFFESTNKWPEQYIREHHAPANPNLSAAQAITEPVEEPKAEPAPTLFDDVTHEDILDPETKKKLESHIGMDHFVISTSATRLRRHDEAVKKFGL